MHTTGLSRCAAKCSTVRHQRILIAPKLAVQARTVPARIVKAAVAAPASAEAQAQQNGRMQGHVHHHNELPALPEVIGSRVAIVKRQTKETSVEVRVNLDGSGQCITNTPVGFFNHMLDQIASHGLFDIYVNAQGDTWIDDHHTVEDIALALGGAFSQALGDRKGIHRFGEFTAPLDEALTHVVLDLSGRAHLSCNLEIPAQKIGNFDTELVEHFFMSFANTSGTTLHIRHWREKQPPHRRGNFQGIRARLEEGD